MWGGVVWGSSNWSKQVKFHPSDRITRGASGGGWENWVFIMIGRQARNLRGNTQTHMNTCWMIRSRKSFHLITLQIALNSQVSSALDLNYDKENVHLWNLNSWHPLGSCLPGKSTMATPELTIEHLATISTPYSRLDHDDLTSECANAIMSSLRAHGRLSSR